MNKSLETNNPIMDIKNKPPFKDVNQKDQAFDMMNKMRRKDLFCDVTLEVEGGSDIRSHKMILASCSPYFYAMFTNFDERNQDRVKIQGVHHSTFEQLINYVYTSEISITDENVRILHQAADFLQFTVVRDACYNFMKTQLKPFNCLGIRDYADKNEYKELLSFADKFVEQNLRQVVEHGEFLALPFERVLQLISNDSLLTVSLVEVIFKSVISWVNFDLESRKKHVTELMQHVRMSELSRSFLVERAGNEPLFENNLQCQKFLIEALKDHLINYERKTNFSQTLKIKPIHYGINGNYYYH